MPSFRGKPAADESTRVRTIDLIDVSGNSAMAKATLIHGGTVFTDYFVLLKVDDEWKIANKVYYGRRNLFRMKKIGLLILIFALPEEIPSALTTNFR